MTDDRLAELLAHTADQWTRDAVAPGPAAVPRRPRRRMVLLRLAPLAAAAAVIAVAVPVVVVSQDGRQPGLTPVAAVQPPVRSEPAETQRIRPSDAGLPSGVTPPLLDPQLAPCAAERLTARLDLGGASLVIAPQPGELACTLPESISLVAPGVDVQRLRQPEVPTPPQFDGRLLDAAGVVMDAFWAGRCTPVNGASVTGIGDGTLSVEVVGSPKACDPGAAPLLRLGPARPAGQPGGLVPADRAGLTLRLDVPDGVAPGGTFDYTVTLTNPTSSQVSLQPCPTFWSTTTDPQVGAGSDRGRLPCDRLPSTLPPRSEVGIVLTAQLMNGGAADAGDRSGTLDWSIAGPAPVRASFAVIRTATADLAPVPYRAPSGEAANPRTFRYKGSGAFPVVIDGPRTARPGQVLRYRAVLTNPAGGATIPLRPCPTWTETLVLAPSRSANPTPTIRTGLVNCSAAPAEVAPAERIAFQMELTVPADTKPGPHQLFWQMQGGIDSEPFDLTVE